MPLHLRRSERLNPAILKSFRASLLFMPMKMISSMVLSKMICAIFLSQMIYPEPGGASVCGGSSLLARRCLQH